MGIPNASRCEFWLDDRADQAPTGRRLSSAGWQPSSRLPRVKATTSRSTSMKQVALRTPKFIFARSRKRRPRLDIAAEAPPAIPAPHWDVVIPEAVILRA